MNWSQIAQLKFLVILAFAFSTAFCLAQPSIQLSSQYGPPTSPILISGQGFRPDVTLAIYFDARQLGQAQTNSSGSFTNATISVPKSALPGRHPVVVSDPTGTRLQRFFQVSTDWVDFGFDSTNSRTNPYENVIGTSTVGSLKQRFSYQMGFGSFSSPAVSHGLLYVGSGDWNLYALNARTGALVWKYRTLSEIYASSPAVYNGVVYFGSEDRYVYALDAQTGVLKWKFLTSDCCDIWSSPVVVDNVVYIGGGGPTMYALDASTGSVLWTFTSGDLISAAPAVSNGIVYFTSYDSYVYALNATNGTLVWKFLTGPYGMLFIAPVLADGLVYINSLSGLYALDAATGNVIWADYSVLGEDASPAADQGNLYVPTDLGLIAYDQKTGQHLWTSSILVFGSYLAAANGVLYAPSYDGNVYGLDESSGTILWSYQSGSNYLISPAVANGIVYFPGGNDQIFAFGIPGATGK